MALSQPPTSAEKYLRWKNEDPFPEIPPALLNSADILDYVNTTGMIDPFRETNDDGEEKLKPASYEVDLLGTILYWDANGKKLSRSIGRGETFTLGRNSIVFVQVEPYFRIPDYLAFRFNLKIQHVYRGILLGTGPLVDPGFEGSLYIPLHNLTDTDYEFRGGEGLIWMEFTKLSWPPPGRAAAQNPTLERVGRYYKFPDRKLKRKSLEDYLRYASPNRPIRSSIPVDVAKSRAAATSAKRTVGWVSAVSIITALGVGATIIALFMQTFSFVRDVRSDFDRRLKGLEDRVSERAPLQGRPATEQTIAPTPQGSLPYPKESPPQR